MNPNADHYNEPHAVVLIFERPVNAKKSYAYESQVLCHEDYYKNLGDLAKIIHYGEVMNDIAVCAIIHVSGAAAFEQIIGNDPGLRSGLYHIKQVIPYANH
jgi:hypothetical protein